MTIPSLTRRINRNTAELPSFAGTAVYTRLAVADDDAIAEQERKLIEYAESNGYGRCVCYRDNGKNGEHLNRPALMELLAGVETGKIKIVIVQDLNRLTRNYWKLDELVNLLTAKDALLISVEDGGVVNGVE
jgi:DNA invertase Pin-like site-specific DNA recombinase